jgi:D-sedoheptulose 7-phosphate isomerase
LNTLIHDSLKETAVLIDTLLGDPETLGSLENLARQLAETFQRKGKLIVFGNGGSMCDAMHLAEELTGRFHYDRPALPAIAISDPGHLSCVANDYGYEQVFARGVEAYAKAGDLVVGISTSGNSANVIKGLEAAIAKECFTAALLGRDGGKLKELCDFPIVVPSQSTARIQEVHGVFIHILIELVEKELFGEVAK